MAEKLRVGVLGATGMVGQKLLELLENHPYFKVTLVAASSKNCGKKLREAIQFPFFQDDEEENQEVFNMTLYDVNDVDTISSKVDVVFCALNMKKDLLVELEENYAKHEIPVISNNSANRWTEDVPMIIPEINSSHLKLIEKQKRRLNTKRGFIVAKPNCSIQSYVPALYAWKEFMPYEVLVTTFQAISGAGKTFIQWPEMISNVIPYIEGEEEKSEREPLRILGNIEDEKVHLKEDLKISAQCIRASVKIGHTASCAVRFRKKVTLDELIYALENVKTDIDKYDLPSKPKTFIQYLKEDNRPEVQKDVLFENGMGISIGRLREDNLFDYKFVGLSNNVTRGAAGGALLLAELLYKEGYFY